MTTSKKAVVSWILENNRLQPKIRYVEKTERNRQRERDEAERRARERRAEREREKRQMQWIDAMARQAVSHGVRGVRDLHAAFTQHLKEQRQRR